MEQVHLKPHSSSSYLIGFRTPQPLNLNIFLGSSLRLTAVWKVKSVKTEESQCKQTGAQQVSKRSQQRNGRAVWVHLPFPHEVNQEMSSVQQNHHLWNDTQHEQRNSSLCSQLSCLEESVFFRDQCWALQMTDTWHAHSNVAEHSGLLDVTLYH